MSGLSRRDFLKSCTGIAAGSVLSRFVKPMPVGAAAMQEFPSVSVAKGISQDTAAQILQTALEGLGGIGRFVKPGQTVAIKPNATWAYPPGTASSTDPEFLRAVIRAVQDAGAARIMVMDHCSIEPGAEPALRISGLGKVVKDMGVEGLFPDRYDAPRSTYTAIDLPYGRANQRIGVINAATQADVRINLAVAKTHNVTKLTMSLKHMMGFLQQPGLLHANLEQGIADISTPSAIQAQLHLLEAIRVRIPKGSYRACAGPETEITHPEIVTRRNTVIAGTDPVLIDAYGCINLFELQPQELTHVLRANESGCGDIDVEAALVDGRIRLLRVGAPIAVSTATADSHVAAAPQSPTSTLAATDLPASESVGRSDATSALLETTYSAADRVVAMDPLLKAALVPAAAVLAGISLAIRNRLRRGLTERHLQTGEQQSHPGDSHSDGAHD